MFLQLHFICKGRHKSCPRVKSRLYPLVGESESSVRTRMGNFVVVNLEITINAMRRHWELEMVDAAPPSLA